MNAIARFGWEGGTNARGLARRALALGVLGGVVLTAMESLILPEAPSLADRIPLALYILSKWTIAGTLIAAFALWAEPRLAPPRVAAGLVALALATAATFAGVTMLLELAGVPAAGIPLIAHVTKLETFVYDVWIMLVFGGFFTAACVLAHRAERLRAARARMAIERSHTEALLAEARLRALEARVDPAFLLRVVAEVERRYAVDGDDADRLLDALSAFLRRAMPGVRGRVGTLGDEIELVRAYAAVWSRVDAQRPSWSVRGDAPAARPAPFPALMLSTLLDHWAAAVPRGSIATLAVAREGASTTLTLVASTPPGDGWLPPDAATRLAIALRLACGPAASLVVTGAPGAALRIALPAATGSERDSPVAEGGVATSHDHVPSFTR